MSQIEAAKREAAEAALACVPEAGVIGLGTGSTARYFIEGLAALVRRGRALRGVATSEASRRQAEGLGIPLLSDEGPWQVDVCVDGADEVSEALDLIKGGGGCHTREKIVNQAARHNVIVVDESKLSRVLGEKWPVPVEVLPFGLGSTRQQLEAFGAATLRRRPAAPETGDVTPAFRTDSGNFIVDVQMGPVSNPRSLDGRLLALPGVVQTGLFLGRCDRVLVAGREGVRELVRPAGS